jgi:hypothetical protein
LQLLELANVTPGTNKSLYRLNIHINMNHKKYTFFVYNNYK